MPTRTGSYGGSGSPYSAAMTREQFLFYEMRTTARLLAEGDSAEEAVRRIVEENLFQYPTERSLRRMARTCIKRLASLGDEMLVEALATEPFDTAKQIALYAMMKSYALVWEFMTDIIGEKYRTRDFAFSRAELNAFFLRLQDEDAAVAAWSEQSVAKLKQVLVKVLVETEYLDSPRAARLNPVWLSPVLAQAIRAHGDTAALPAFNCFD